MAFAIVNKRYEDRSFVGVPAVHKEVADATAIAATDLGVVGLLWLKGRVVIKSGMANTNTAIFTVRVGTGAALTAPELVHVSPTMTFVTGDGTITHEFVAFSNNGFQSYKVDVTNSGGTASFDFMLDAG